MKSHLRPLKRAYRQSINALTRPFDERWMYDQFIPIQAVNRSALEYDLTYYDEDEFHAPPPMTDPGLAGFRELPLHYQPVALPKPYYFTVNDAVICGTDIVATNNPERIFLETYPEVSQFVEGSNHYIDRALRKQAVKYGQSADYDFETAYFFPSRAAQNYYHFLVDSCFRFLELERSGVVASDTKILFNKMPTPWQMKHLKLLNISEDRIVVTGRKMTKVKNMVISASRRQRFAVSRQAIDAFGARMRAGFDIPDTPTPKRFLISRSLAKSRKIENEEALVEALTPYGFEVALLENMSNEEQINLFANAECIVAPHGAALTNLIYANAPHVIELIPTDFWGWGYFIPLTHTMGGQHRAIVGQGRDHYKEDFSVDIDAVLRAVSDLSL